MHALPQGLRVLDQGALLVIISMIAITVLLLLPQSSYLYFLNIFFQLSILMFQMVHTPYHMLVHNKSIPNHQQFFDFIKSKVIHLLTIPIPSPCPPKASIDSLLNSEGKKLPPPFTNLRLVILLIHR